MKKVALGIIGFIVGMMIITNLDGLLGLVISLGVLFIGMHFYQKNEGGLQKIFWTIVFIVALISVLGNISGVIAVLAAIGLYVVWKMWQRESKKNHDIMDAKEKKDPFTNFEKTWEQLTQNK